MAVAMAAAAAASVEVALVSAVLQIVTVHQHPNRVRPNLYEMVCISNGIHNPIMTANENLFYFIHTAAASGSGDQSNLMNGMATALPSSNLANQMESKPNFISSKTFKSTQNDNDVYLQQLSYNRYDQTLNKLMGDFSEIKHKRNINNARNSVDDRNTQNDNPDVKDVNFWTKILFNNNDSSNNTNNESPRSTEYEASSSHAIASFDISKKKPLAFNGIFSKLNDFHRSEVRTDMNDVDVLNRNFNILNSDSMSKFSQQSDANVFANATGASGSDLPKFLLSSNKIKPNNLTQNRRDPVSYIKETSQFNGGTFHELPDNELTPKSLNNDLNAANSTFLRALNDLHLDYNELTFASHRENHDQSESAPHSTSKERYTSN